MSKKKNLIPDENAYIDFLTNSPLATQISEKWFVENLLGRALLHVLSKKGLVDYHEVVNVFDRLSKITFENMLDLKVMGDPIPLKLEFATTEQDLNSATRLLSCHDACDEYMFRLEKLIPKAIIRKYIAYTKITSWDTPSVRSLCAQMAECTDVEEMFDLMITAEPEEQRAMVAKLSAFMQYLNKFSDRKDEYFQVPERIVGALRQFLIGDWDAIQPIAEK